MFHHLRTWTLIVIVLAMFSVAGSLTAQEATVEPSAPEVTAEPTVVEPTVAPTVEPTIEPTVEVTTEPTVEVTAEPTVEVTTEPTVEATAEAPVEVTAEPTVEPTVEVTPEPEPFVMLVGDALDSGASPYWTLGAGWEFSGGGLRVKASDAPLTSIYGTFFDGAVQASFTTGKATVLLRYNTQTGTSYGARLATDGTLELLRAGVTVSTFQITPFDASLPHWLRLDVRGGELTASVDGLAVLSFTDNAPLPPGTAAFVGDVASDMLFDNLSIFVPASQVGNYPPPAVLPPTAEPTVEAGRIGVAQIRPPETQPSGGIRMFVTSPDDDIFPDNFCTLPEALMAANGTADNECGNGNDTASVMDEIFFEIKSEVDGVPTGFGNGPYNIRPFACELPPIIQRVHINGYSQEGAQKATLVSSAIFRINLDGQDADGDCDGPGPLPANNTPDGFRIMQGGDGTIIEGIAINRYLGDGIEIRGASNVIIRGNIIGLNVEGATDSGNNGNGIIIRPQAFAANGAGSGDDTLPSNATGTTVGGTTPADRNIIAGNTVHGVYIAPLTSHLSVDYTANNTLIVGNYIGLDINGSSDASNIGTHQYGVYVDNASGTQIGSITGAVDGQCRGGCNVISGNDQSGVIITGLLHGGNSVVNNFIGLNAAGTGRVPNGKSGVIIAGGGFTNIIGGTAPGSRNVITGNTDYGIVLQAAGSFRQGGTIVGNYIGTNPAGTGLVTTASITGNAKGGIQIAQASEYQIGGTTAAERNIISGNQGATGAADVYGIHIAGTSSVGEIFGNFIGLNVSGTAALGNRTGGILLLGGVSNGPTGNFIGGINISERNIISGNGTATNAGSGIELRGAGTRDNFIRGNFIGLDLSGTADVGNTGDGIRIVDAIGNFIGGDENEAFNIIAGNDGDGIEITTVTAQKANGNRIQNNRIGTNSDDSDTNPVPLANSGNGIHITGDAFRNQIGADPALENDNSGNHIAFNTLAGVYVNTTTVLSGAGVGNSIMKNVLRGNGGLGIDLGTVGVTSNDSGDSDSGPNRLQNFPTLTLIERNQPSAGQLRITGTLATTPNPDNGDPDDDTRYRIDFFANETCDTTNFGEGQSYLGTLYDQTANADGIVSFVAVLNDAPAGFDKITFTATEKLPTGGGNLFEWSTSEFSPCVDRNNNAPTISDITNKTTNFATPISGITFTVSDVESINALTFSLSSSDPAKVPPTENCATPNLPGWCVTGTGANRSLTIRPDDDLTDHGAVNIILTVTDPQNASAQDVFVLTIEPPNQNPTIGIIDTQGTSPNQSTPPFSFTVNDPDGNVNAITLTATSDNTAVVPDTLVCPATVEDPYEPGYCFTGSGATRTLVITPNPGAFLGTVNVTITATDEDFGTGTRTFALTISTNQPPTMAALTGATAIVMNAVNASLRTFTVADSITPVAQLAVTATSSNQALLKDSNITVTVSGASRTILATPENGQYGWTIITVTVTDSGGLTASDTFILGVRASGTAPTFVSPATLPNATIPVNTSTNPVNITINDDGSLTSVNVVYLSSNQAVLPNNSPSNFVTQVVGGNPATRSYQIFPVNNAVGTSVVDVVLVDGLGGINFKSFTLTVTPNTPPTLTFGTLANPTTLPNSNPATTGYFVIGDNTTPLDQLLITTTSSNTTLIPNSAITVQTVVGQPTRRTLLIDPNNGFGSSTITIRVAEPGVGGLFVESTFVVQVQNAANTGNPVIELPASISNITVQRGQSVPQTCIKVADTGAGTTPADQLTVTATSSNQTLLPNANITIATQNCTGVVGGNRVISLAPVSIQTGSTTITVVVDDNQGRSSNPNKTFVLTVNEPPNQPPVIDPISDQFTRPDTPKSVTFEVNDADDLIAQIVTEATSSNQSVLPNTSLNIQGTTDSRTLVIDPVGSALGSTTITITANDGTVTTSRQFLFTIANNVPPTIEPISDQITSYNVTAGPILVEISDFEDAAEDLTISAASNNPVLVPNGNILFGGSGAERTISIIPAFNQGGTATITVEVTDLDGFTTTETFILDVNNAAPVIVAPINNGTATTLRPLFSWKAIKGIANFRLQVSTESTFSSGLVLDTTVAGVKFTPTNALNQRSYYWRVRGQDGSNNPMTRWTNPIFFTVNLLKAPLDGGFTTDTTPAFTWFTGGAGLPHLVQVFNNVDLSGSPVATCSGTTTCTSPVLTPGIYYWRLNVNNVVSEVSRMLIITTPPPTPPVITSPTANQVTTDSTFEFTWNDVTGFGTVTYQLQVDNVSKFTSPEINELSVSNNQFASAVSLPDGKYFLRIRTINNLGAFGAWSAARPFTVNSKLMKAPATGGYTFDRTPTFTWTAAPGKQYVFQLSETTDFAVLETVSCTMPTTLLTCTPVTNLDLDQYYWRVNLVGEDPVPTYFSLIVTDVILAPPVIVVPTNNGGTSDSTPTISWTAVGGALSYDVQIATASNFKPETLVANTSSATNFTEIVPGLMDGKYFVRIRTINQHGAPGAWNKPIAFVVDTVAPLATNVTAPVNNTIVTNGKPQIKWKAVKGVTRFWVQIATSPTFASSSLVVSNSYATKTSYTLQAYEALPEGTYYVRVRAIDAAGNVGPVGTTARFVVDMP